MTFQVIQPVESAKYSGGYHGGNTQAEDALVSLKLSEALFVVQKRAAIAIVTHQPVYLCLKAGERVDDLNLEGITHTRS